VPWVKVSSTAVSQPIIQTAPSTPILPDDSGLADGTITTRATVVAANTRARM